MYWHQLPSRFPKCSLLLLVSVLAAAATLPSANANDVFSNVNSSLSVLANFKANGQIFTKPYPYIVIEDALDIELYSQLADNFLTNLDILRLNGEPDEAERKQNYRYDVRAQQTLAKGSTVSELWKEFIRYHASREFFDEVLSILGSHIQKAHPSMAKAPSIGLRFNDTKNAEVLLDCQVAMNAPVTVRSAVRGPHIDGPAEVFAGLLYFRDQTDLETKGGDLQVLECKNPPCKKMDRKERARYGTGDTHYKPRDVHIRNTVPYKANMFVLFVNSVKAIHGVTPRSVTPFSRRLVNVVAVRRGVGKMG
eukprot:CAMPEP_0198215434 /NCGR_PEP_ID=MMETSP1445-20131203/49877_1 /TAXON_ID=36898 /ORGANISM="Pyramimonas sp., Strain CCMP2087" /LENGTH=307 /DNA_ID=CAMNT_0043891151 /DNA_START=285 /DNA_END=1208 /DNA_ORIENTATION=-